MTKTQIIVDDIVLDVDVNIAITFQADSVEDLGERARSFSYTITLPGTNKINEFFQNIFDLSVDTNSNIFFHAQQNVVNKDARRAYNPKKQKRAQLKIGGLIIFDGFLLLDSITKNKKEVFYNVRFISDKSTWVELSKAVKINELDLGTLCFDKTTVENTWLAPNDLYVCPFINYGNLQNDYPSNPRDIDINDIFIAVYVKKILELGFAQIGFDFESGFLGMEYPNMIIPFSNERWQTLIGLLGTDVFEADITTPVLMWHASPPLSPFEYYTGWQDVTLGMPEVYSNQTFPVPISNVFTVKNDWACGLVCQNFEINCIVELKDKSSGFGSINVVIELLKSDGITTTIIASQTISTASTLDTTHTINFNEQICLEVDEYVFLRFGHVPGTRSYKAYLNYSYIKVTLSDFKKENIKFDLAKQLPDITLFDLIKDITTLFNAYILEDTRTLKLLKWDEYYYQLNDLQNPQLTDRVQNWHAQWDVSKDVNISFLFNNFAREITISYKKDNDVLSKEYEAVNNQTYSTFVIKNDAENSEQEQKIELKTFASALTAALKAELSDYVVPHLIEKPLSELPVANKTAWHARFLLYELENKTNGWNINYGNYTIQQSVFVHPKAFVKNSLQSLELPDLYEKFWAKKIKIYLNNRIVTLACYLNISDIAPVDFRKMVKIDNKFFYLSKILQFNVKNYESTTVELIQILE